MQPATHESLPPQRRRAQVFAQPFVVSWIAVWLVNDHVLKDHYASWWTGKLSDVAGLIVFPLIIAALIERRSNHPVRWAIGATIVFYGSINLLAAADAATERVIGMFIGPVTLTMDPTDLLVLPALAGAWWAWSAAPARSAMSIRRSWGRIVFAAAVATTLATSPPSAQSETFAGTVLLTDETPSLQIPITFTLDGEDSDDLSALRTQIKIVPYGQVPTYPITETLEFAEPGSGVFGLALVPGVSGPVEVQWTLSAWTEGEGGLFGGTDPAEPVLTAAAPSDTFGPEPAYEVGLQIPGPGESPAYRLAIEAGPDTTIRMVTTRPTQPDHVRVATEDATGWLAVDTPVDLVRPARCEETSAEVCRFDVYLGAARRWDIIDLVVLVLEGNAQVVEQGTVEMTSHALTGTTPTYRFEKPGERPLVVGLSFDPIADPLAAAMTFLELSLDESASTDGILVRPWVQPMSFADVCCSDGQLNTWHHRNDLLADDPFESSLEFELNWEAVVWSPAEIDAQSITVTIE